MSKNGNESGEISLKTVDVGPLSNTRNDNVWRQWLIREGCSRHERFLGRFE